MSFGVKMLRYSVACQIVFGLILQMMHAVDANTLTQFMNKGVPSNLDQLDTSVSCRSFFPVLVLKKKFHHIIP